MVADLCVVGHSFTSFHHHDSTNVHSYLNPLLGQSFPKPPIREFTVINLNQMKERVPLSSFGNG